MNHDGTLETIDGRPALRFERTLPHSIERVWRAVSEPAELAQWFPAAAEWTPSTGETFEAFGATGEVLEADPPHRLVWTFGGERYSFELTALEGGCRLVFVHVFDDRGRAAQTATGWDAYLSRLEPHLAGHPISEAEAHTGQEQVQRRYAERFGPDRLSGRAIGRRHRAAAVLGDLRVARARQQGDVEDLLDEVLEAQEAGDGAAAQVDDPDAAGALVEAAGEREAAEARRSRAPATARRRPAGRRSRARG